MILTVFKNAAVCLYNWETGTGGNSCGTIYNIYCAF